MSEEQQLLPPDSASASLAGAPSGPDAQFTPLSKLTHFSWTRITPRAETLRWVSGLYLLLLGLSFLLLPQGKLGVWLEPIWLIGTWMLLSGLALLWLGVLSLSKRVSMMLMIMIAIPLLVISILYAYLLVIPAAATLFLFSLGIICIPLIPPAQQNEASRPDALALILGTIVAVQGFDFLLRPDAASSIPTNLGLSPAIIGLLFVASGCAVVIVQYITRTPAVLRWLAHLCCGLVILGLLAAIAILIDPLYWVLGAATILRGVVVILLPWWSMRAARFDPNSFRPRVALALVTAAIIPVAIALPTVLATIPQSSPEQAMARQVAFGSTLLIMLLAGIGGWWLAGRLSAPLSQLMQGVDRIAMGGRTQPLPRQGTSELVRLTESVEQMAQALDERNQQTEAALQSLISVAQVLVLSSEIPHGVETDGKARAARRLLSQICSTFDCSAAIMVVLEPETAVIDTLVTSGLSQATEQALLERIRNTPLSQHIEGSAVLTQLQAGKVVALDASQIPYHTYHQQQENLAESLLIPMRLGGILMGMITLSTKKPGTRFSDEKLALAGAVGSLAALLIERERLFLAGEQARAGELAAQQATQQMDTFLSIVSHELKTPITAIKGNLQLASRQLQHLSTQETTNGKEPVTTILMLLNRAQRQIDMQTRLVNDLLDVSRIQANLLELQITQCDLVPLVKEVVEDQRILTPGRSIEVRSSFEHALVSADAGRVEQVISNYLTNALKYSETNQVVKVSVELVDTMVRVAVQDYGPGLTPEQQQRVWERLYRVPGINVKSGTGVGLGLGLHICKHLIERQGGQVGVESVPGSGSTFWLTLPLAVGYEHKQIATANASL